MPPPASACRRLVRLACLVVAFCAVVLFVPWHAIARAEASAPLEEDPPQGDVFPLSGLVPETCSGLPECGEFFLPVVSEPPKIITYTVQEGDSVWSIAVRFHLDIDTLRWSNPELARNPDLLRVGQVLTILPVRGAYHIVQEGETLESIAKTYGVDPAVIVAYPLNALREPVVLQVGQKLVIPGGRKDVRLPKPPLSPDYPFAWPLWGEISQGYKSGHPAIDIAGPYDTPVYAARAGRVIFSGFSNVGYGYMVILDHGDGLTSLYGHLKGDYVAVGQRVKRGEMIGRLGSTGNSTGPHLHFEIRRNGERQNPLRFLPSR